MQRRYRCKDIGIPAVNGVENGAAQQLVKTSQTRYIARSIEYRLKTVVHGIPGRCSRMDIISGKTYEIHQQEYHRKAQVHFTVALQVKPQTKSNGHRYPTQVKDARKKSAAGQWFSAKYSQGISVIPFTDTPKRDFSASYNPRTSIGFT